MILPNDLTKDLKENEKEFELIIDAGYFSQCHFF